MAEICRDDLAVIRELERRIGREIPVIEGRGVKWNEVGCRVDGEGRVVGLSLYRCGLRDATPICRLRNLTELYLISNQLASLPEWLGRLTNLTELYLGGNQLTSLPEWLGRLTNLTRLSLGGNQLTSLPEGLSKLTNLNELHLVHNQLTSLPEGLSKLTNLTRLDLDNNQLTSLPEGLGGLTNLTRLYLRGNQLTSLPVEIGKLKKLTVLDLKDNPIKLPPQKIIAQGTETIIRYLALLLIDRELEKVRRRYEGKLMLLGDGEEGKTCVSRALRGLPFVWKQDPTRGVDVVPWPFAHPDEPGNKEKEITLNIWDFEGQEIHHQTHQFFLSAGALYLLVFKCRELFNMERAEYWLDTIKARAPKSRVLLVITGCEQRTPLVPLDKLQANYGDVLYGRQPEDWFYPVGCEDNSGIDALRERIQLLAADMDVMGREWPDSYGKAEEALIELRGSEENMEAGRPHVSRKELYDIYEKAGIFRESYDSTAEYMDSLGLITQFADCEKLRDFIVLKPQWLTKAISLVLEDKEVQQNKGYAGHERIRRVWAADYPDMFLRFHECMKEFELCYDLDQRGACLVPLRFDMIKPAIPWALEPDGEIRERRVYYRLNIRPPMGLMSRFIVKTHRMIAKTEEQPLGVCWYNGVFLRKGEDLQASEALCEFDPGDRMLCITVRAAFPQAMQEQLREIAEAVFAFYEGIQAERFYGCIQFEEPTNHETNCRNKHSEDSIYSHLIETMPILCTTRDEEGKMQRHKVDARQLVYGFTSFGTPATKEDLREAVAELRADHELLKVGQDRLLLDYDKLLDELDAHFFAIKEQQKDLPAVLAQRLGLCMNNYLAMLNEMLDNRDFTSAPGLMIIRPLREGRFNRKDWFLKDYVLTPYCEYEGEMHRCSDASVIFKQPQVWWENTAPLLSLAFKTLTIGVSIAAAGAPLAIAGAAGATTAIGTEVYKNIKTEADFMKEMLGHLSRLSSFAAEKTGKAVKGRYEMIEFGAVQDYREEVQRAARIQLQRLLREIAPDQYEARKWGDMRRVRMPDNTYRWMCGEHAKKMDR